MVRETPVRRRISVTLVIALAAAIGLFAGTKLPRSSNTPPPDPYAPVEFNPHPDAYPRARLLLQGCDTPENASVALHEFRQSGVRDIENATELCVQLARGLPALTGWLRTLDAAARQSAVRRLYLLRGGEDLADALYDLNESYVNAHTPAMYNLRRGNEDRARQQLRRYVESQVNPYDFASPLILEALDARAAQRAGGSKR